MIGTVAPDEKNSVSSLFKQLHEFLALATAKSYSQGSACLVNMKT
jgi:hypothetical protein